MTIGDVIKEGVMVKEKKMGMRDRCADCGKILMLRTYYHDGKMKKVVYCKNCNTYAVIPEKKKYSTNIRPVKKPRSLE